MKYIDADKLKEEIERQLSAHDKVDRWDIYEVEKAWNKGHRRALENILSFIDSLQQEQLDMGEVSDGYHTFNELYYYRMLYNAAFFNELAYKRDNGHWDVDYDVHKSKKHSDGEDCFGGGWFIVMAELPTGQISNHYEMKDWDLFQIPEREFADEWDGHTPQEAADRLYKYLQQGQPDGKYTKRNELFDKCVASCDPKVMKEVSDNVDKLKSISTPAKEDWFKISEEWEKEDKKSATERDELKNVHDLKILPEYFRAVKNGEKTFEVRFNDRNFQKGDILHLREWDWIGYTGESIYVKVTYILNDPGYCKEGYIIMAISKKEGKKSATECDELEKAIEEQIDRALFKWSYDDEDGIEQYVDDSFRAGVKWAMEHKEDK